MRRHLVVLICLGAASACGDEPPGRTYYERNIEPILVQNCAKNTSGCHSTNDTDPFKFAAGNFDVTTFENVQKRRDVLTQFGAYPYPLLLIKAAGPQALKMPYNGKFLDIDVLHSGGGSILDTSSDAFLKLQDWLNNGATENGVKPSTPAKQGTGGCTSVLPPGFTAASVINATTQASFDNFKQAIQPIFNNHGCNAASCHGAPQSDFYLTCGTNNDELAFNFVQAWSFVNNPVDDSQLLRVPLTSTISGRNHTGGDQFSSVDDFDFKVLRTWASQAGVLDFAKGDANKKFFADNVQPVLLTRGCQFQACHSPAANNDFKLRTGTINFFSAVALQRNYDLLKNEFLAIEFPDARRGRAVAKTVLADDDRVTTIAGIPHRGGAVLETPTSPIPADPATCPAATAYCTIQQWLDLERASLGAQVTSMKQNDPIKVVYIERTAGGAAAGRLEFDEFHAGADLRVGSTTFGANQTLNQIDPVADTQSLLTNCAAAGVSAGGDIQSPSVANDGTRVVFAGRNTQNEPLGVYVVNIDGTGCARITPQAPDSNNLKVHNFDPVFSPDGQYVVFASTRGKGGNSATKSRRRFLPQSDLWRIKVNGNAPDQATLEQMTFLSNSEVGPGFMREGRVTMTTEKTSQGFYQLSGRRINWDLTDYHPLLAQRKDSLYSDPADLARTGPSIGYSSATDIREASNGDFLLVLADNNPMSGAPALPGGGGALAIFNRSIGPFEQGRGDDGYLRSMRVLGDPAATGRAGAASSYRRPVSLPDGTIMVSYASQASTANFQIVMLNPRSNTQTPLFTGGGNLRMDAVLAYKYPARQLYANRRQLVFGGGADFGDTGHAALHMPDAPMVFTLLTGNLRRGRPVDEFRRLTESGRLVVYSEAMCPGNCTANTNGIFEMRAMLGSADLAADGSVRVQLPSQMGVVLELQDSNGKPIVTMGEEHQLGPGEQISMGVQESLFNATCGGCHGSISGQELDVAVTPDVLTGASQSSSKDTMQRIGP